MQLSVTVAAITWTKLDPELDGWMKHQYWPAMGLFLVAFVIEIMILCCKGFARKVPTNYILLGIFTLCMAFFFAFATSLFTPASALMAGGMTLAMTVALTVYACTTKTDFTVCGSLFFVLSIAVFMLIVVSLFMRFAAWWHPFFAAVMVCIYALYLIYDTQLIAGGKSHELSLDDYVVGSLILYVDIMGLFL